MFVDELGYCILTLLQYRSDISPAQLLPTCLTIFSSLRRALGPCVGVVTEWFVKQVYIKTILQVASVFTGEKLSSVRFFLTYLVLFYLNFAPFQKNEAFLNIEDLEVVLESLCDLVSDVSFIPSLYASFDSNPSKPDIVFPLVENVSKCCW